MLMSMWVDDSFLRDIQLAGYIEVKFANMCEVWVSEVPKVELGGYGMSYGVGQEELCGEEL